MRALTRRSFRVTAAVLRDARKWVRMRRRATTRRARGTLGMISAAVLLCASRAKAELPEGWTNVGIGICGEEHEQGSQQGDFNKCVYDGISGGIDNCARQCAENPPCGAAAGRTDLGDGTCELYYDRYSMVIQCPMIQGRAGERHVPGTYSTRAARLAGVGADVGGWGGQPERMILTCAAASSDAIAFQPGEWKSLGKGACRTSTAPQHCENVGRRGNCNDNHFSEATRLDSCRITMNSINATECVMICRDNPPCIGVTHRCSQPGQRACTFASGTWYCDLHYDDGAVPGGCMESGRCVVGGRVGVHGGMTVDGWVAGDSFGRGHPPIVDTALGLGGDHRNEGTGECFVPADLAIIFITSRSVPLRSMDSNNSRWPMPATWLRRNVSPKADLRMEWPPTRQSWLHRCLCVQPNHCTIAQPFQHTGDDGAFSICELEELPHRLQCMETARRGVRRVERCPAANVGLANATVTCEGVGARLCSATEVVPAARGTGCGHDDRYVWTATPCDTGHLRVKGNNAGDTQCALDGDTAAVRCCADRHDAPAASPGSRYRFGMRDEDACPVQFQACGHGQYACPSGPVQSDASGMVGGAGSPSQPVTPCDGRFRRHPEQGYSKEYNRISENLIETGHSEASCSSLLDIPSDPLLHCATAEDPAKPARKACDNVALSACAVAARRCDDAVAYAHRNANNTNRCSLYSNTGTPPACPGAPDFTVEAGWEDLNGLAGDVVRGFNERGRRGRIRCFLPCPTAPTGARLGFKAKRSRWSYGALRKTVNQLYLYGVPLKLSPNLQPAELHLASSHDDEAPGGRASSIRRIVSAARARETWCTVRREIFPATACALYCLLRLLGPGNPAVGGRTDVHGQFPVSLGYQQLPMSSCVWAGGKQ
eukprot:gene9933-biopygen11862